MKQMSMGRCYLCGGTFSRRSMTGHLKACRQAPHPSSVSSGGTERTASLFHVMVEGRHLPQYWLHLERYPSMRLWRAWTAS
mgnify:CR=1 FL=1